MATLVLKTNAGQATNVTINDVGIVVPSGGLNPVTVTDSDTIRDIVDSDDLKTAGTGLLLDDAFGAGSSTIILNDGLVDIAQADVLAFLSVVTLPSTGPYSVPLRDSAGDETVATSDQVISTGLSSGIVDGGLTLINLSPHIREIFQIAGFDNIFEIA